MRERRERVPHERDHGPVLFFDGECILCNGFADFVLRRDRRHALRLATLQGTTAAALLGDAVRIPAAGEEDGVSGAAPVFLSMIYRDEDGVFRKSEAVRRVLSRLGGLWRGVSALMGLVPRPVRDAVYDVVARNRLRWFGRRAACRMPTPGERDRFLP